MSDLETPEQAARKRLGGKKTQEIGLTEALQPFKNFGKLFKQQLDNSAEARRKAQEAAKVKKGVP